MNNSSPAHNTDMNVNTTDLAGATPLPREGKRVKIVQLSGPIRITVPIEEGEDINEHVKAETSPNAPADTNHQPQADKSRLLPTQGDHEDLVPKTNTTCAIPRSEGHTQPKKFDHNNPDDTLSRFCPYIPGDEILLKTSRTEVHIKAVILKTFPATLSCCMVLRFVEPAIFNNTSQCLLKLYDRRFSTQLRNDMGAKPWAPEIEQQYRDFVDCLDAAEYFSYWWLAKKHGHDCPWPVYNNHERWSAAKLEAYIHFNCIDMYEDEKKAYELMSDLQGEYVPKVLENVMLDQPYAFKELEEDEEYDVHKSLTSIPGILMQYLDGFHLTDLHKHLPSEHWQSILDMAIQTIGKIQACGIYNRDVNTRSIMVDPMTHQVRMIDFGMVYFRENFKSERDWEKQQAFHDEEGDIGMTMPSYLKRDTGITVYYNRSERARRLDWRFNMEEGEHEGGTEEEDEYVRQDILYDQEERGLLPA